VVELRYFGGLTVEETVEFSANFAGDSDARLETGEVAAISSTGQNWNSS
jgi:hypothetical protein